MFNHCKSFKFNQEEEEKKTTTKEKCRIDTNVS